MTHDNCYFSFTFPCKNTTLCTNLHLIPNFLSDMALPPQPTVSLLSSTSARVSWSLPPSSGLPIVFIKIQYRELNSRRKNLPVLWNTVEDDIPPSTTSYVVKKLKTGALRLLPTRYSHRRHYIIAMSLSILLSSSMQTMITFTSKSSSSEHSSRCHSCLNISLLCKAGLL